MVADSEAAFSLADAKTGDSVVIARLSLAVGQQRLEALGLVPGTALKLERVYPGGALVVQLRGATLAIDRKLARGVHVVPRAGGN